MNVSFVDLLKTGTFSDYCLTINGKQFHLHRAILAERSNYFEDIFEKDPNSKIGELTVPDKCFAYIENVLEWLYSNPNFFVTPQTFPPVLQLSLILKIESLQHALKEWLEANVTEQNVMHFFFQINTFKMDIPDEILKIIFHCIVQNFDVLDRKDISNLSYQAFIHVITCPTFSSSTYRKSVAISDLMANKSDLTEEEKNVLINFYIEADWPGCLSQIINSIDQKHYDTFLVFAAKHFRRITVNDLSKMPHQFLVSLIERLDLNAPNDNFVMERLQALTSSSTNVKKQNNRRLWQAFVGDGVPRVFRSLSIQRKDLRVIVIGSVYMDVLLSIKNMLIRGGIIPENIFVFNADTSFPSTDLLFQFDVVFAFTHYQFMSPQTVSDALTAFVLNGGGLVYCYGFCRSDDWGCGEGKLLEFLPLTRGPPAIRPSESNIIVKSDSPIIDQIKEISIGEFCPRASVNVTEDATLIAEYSDGIPLIAEKAVPSTGRSIIGINFYPVSKDIHRQGYDPQHPWDKVFARAVLHSCGLEL